MKIVTKDNFERDLFTERVIAENVNEYYGKQLVKFLNDKYRTDVSEYYFELVADDYKPYDGYKELL